MINRFGILIQQIIFFIILTWFIHFFVHFTMDQNNAIECTREHLDKKLIVMRITGYLPTGNKTALGQDVIVGKTAAISPDCSFLLDETVYVHGHGIRYVNDLTASWLDEEHGICTLDLAVPNKQEALKIGNTTSKVIRLTNIE